MRGEDLRVTAAVHATGRVQEEMLEAADELDRLNALLVRDGSGSIVTQARYNACVSEIERLRQDAVRCAYIRKNPYHAMDLILDRVDVGHPALWAQDFNNALDMATSREGM